MMLDTKSLLLEFSSKTGVSGREDEAVHYAAGLLSPFGKTVITALGSVVCTVKEPRPDGPHLLLDAHIDEVGMIVTCVDEKGFLRVSNCGGVDRRILAAAPIRVHTVDGALPGVVCSTPPHLSTGDKKNPKVDEIYIDIGYSREEAEKRVFPGDRVTIDTPARNLLGGIVSGKALDDRAGCVTHLKALEYLGDRSLDCGLSVVFSSMEEVGGMGAKTAAYAFAPTHAIAVDVSFARTPDADKEKCGEMGKGPMIGIAPILNRHMSDSFIRLARDNHIPYQLEVMGGRTGTNADSIVTSHYGVVTGLLSIPQKYMHTPIETVLADDVDNTAKLIAAYIAAFRDLEVQ
ncbi:M42 family peptidase [Ruminococcaceae bacterium OttesenSCG-928-L11]|nr:M42 family peptidase [Ruminococcaceae bacterium OttesenSCG-928-L11]